MSAVQKSQIVAILRPFSSVLRTIPVVLAAGLLMVHHRAPLWVLIPLFWTILSIDMSVTIGRRLRDTADKPFSFCLPGYRESLRRSIFLAASCFGLGLTPFGVGIWWLEAFGSGETKLLGVGPRLVGMFFVGVAVSLCLDVDLRFIVSRVVWALVLLLSIPLFLVSVVAFSAFVAYPLVGIPSTLAGCIVVWIGLGDMRRVKRGHRMIIEDALERRVQVGVTKTVPPWVEDLFGRLIEHRHQLHATRLVWSSLYRTFGLLFSYWKWMLISIVGSALVLGYIGAWRAFVALGLAACAVRLPIWSDFLLPEGRREKRRAAVAAAAATTVLLAGTASLIVVLSWCLAPFMPRAFGGDYAGLSLVGVYLPSGMVPWIFLQQLLDCGALGRAPTSILRVTAVAMGAIAFFDPELCHWAGIARPAFFAAAFVSGWAFFLLMSRHLCTRGDLV